MSMQPNWPEPQHAGLNSNNSKLTSQRPTLTALMSRLGVALNCAEDECRTMTNHIVHGNGPAPDPNEAAEGEPSNLLARMEAYLERAEGLSKALAYLREHI